jgi:ribonuclease-3
MTTHHQAKENQLDLLQESIDYHFSDEQLLVQALTHKSYAHEHNIANNERLEFLGDAILQFVISDHLMSRYPDLTEGMLSKFRAVLVSESGLSILAGKINLGRHLFIGKGEEATGGREKSSILSDALEALLSAIYLDSYREYGVREVKRIALKLFKNEITKAEKTYTSTDYKTDLQELVQKSKIGTLQYKVIKETGPDHDKEFVTAILINDEEYGIGTGKSKKLSEQGAAVAALKKLRKNDG